MKIDEAIRILRLSKGDLAYETQKEVSQAKKLGIEALKVIKEYHDYFIREGVVPLPGETEE